MIDASGLDAAGRRYRQARRTTAKAVAASWDRRRNPQAYRLADVHAALRMHDVAAMTYGPGSA
jgi:hypothetical protein